MGPQIHPGGGAQTIVLSCVANTADLLLRDSRLHGPQAATLYRYDTSRKGILAQLMNV
jgi:hypothetical protein